MKLNLLKFTNTKRALLEGKFVHVLLGNSNWGVIEIRIEIALDQNISTTLIKNFNEITGNSNESIEITKWYTTKFCKYINCTLLNMKKYGTDNIKKYVIDKLNTWQMYRYNNNDSEKILSIERSIHEN